MNDEVKATTTADNVVDYDLKIQLASPDYKKTLNIEDPNQSASGASVKAAMSGFLDNGWLIDANGNAYTTVVSPARFVTTTPIVIPED